MKLLNKLILLFVLMLLIWYDFGLESKYRVYSVFIFLFLFWLWFLRRKEIKRKGIPQQIKYEVLKRQSGTCAFCSENRNKLLEFHHKDGNPNNNVVENIVGLCPTCHSMKSRYDNTKR